VILLVIVFVYVKRNYLLTWKNINYSKYQKSIWTKDRWSNEFRTI